MFKYISFLAILFLSCEDNSTNVPEKLTGQLVRYNFQYDITASTNFKKEALAKLFVDTLIISDYWAVSKQHKMSASAIISDDTILINYATVDTPLPIITDWSPTVETTVNIVVTKLPPLFILKIGSVSIARKPDSLETALGMRNAGTPLIQTISKTSL